MPAPRSQHRATSIPPSAPAARSRRTSAGGGFGLDVAIQPDGKIVAVGAGPGGNDFALARYNTDGSLDLTFDADGKVTTDFGGGGEYAIGVAIQSDGKIVAAGPGPGGNDFALARYNTDGSLDSTFDADGKVTTDFGGASDPAASLAIQSDGKIVAGGLGPGRNDFALARYNTDGSLDPAFGAGGKVTTNFGGGVNFGTYVAVQPDGKIVAVGTGASANDLALARYNTDGSLDSAFGAGGKVLTDFGGCCDSGASVALQPDGKIVAGAQGPGPNGFALARYNTDGSLDSTFGAAGKVLTGFGGSKVYGTYVAIQSNGKIVAVGNGPGSSDFALARYNTDGSLDSTFGAGGKILTDFGGVEDRAFSVAIQPDGKIVAVGAGPGGSGFALARYKGDDTTPPVIAAYANVTEEATSAAGAVVNYTSPATHDAVDGDGTAICSPASDDTFALGDTTVTCNATDTAGNAATPTTFTVHVVDTTPPAITVPADISVYASSASSAVVSYTASATDLVDGPVDVTCSPSSGSSFSAGTTTVTCSAADSHGNSGSRSFTVRVSYNWAGFFRPVDNPGTGTTPVYNVMKAGAAVPVKFSLGGDQGLGVITSLTRDQVPCESFLILDGIEQTVAAGGSSLSYDPTTATYTYVWKTDKAWSSLTSKCRLLDMELIDGTHHVAYFKFTK